MMPQTGSGVLKLLKSRTQSKGKGKGKGKVKAKSKIRGLLVDPAEYTGSDVEGIYVPEQLLRKYNITEGATVTGRVKNDGRGMMLDFVETIGGLAPDQFRMRQPYTRLTAITPEERFNLSATGDTSMRIVDLLAPIAKGTRGLIVSPPRAGKTMLLEQIAMGIQASDPETRIIVLLIDERPEEVTHFRRSVNAEVIASSNDRNTKEHIALTEFVMAHVTTELECGKDVVVLMDSLTRMSRAFNLHGAGQVRGRTMSGGLGAGALEVPRRFFGMARNVEHGGSVTIIATVLVDTGSRMDQLIFEEFKGTGNSEIVLDRKVAEARVYPAINIPSTGTRREEMLYNEEQFQQVTKLRRALAGLKTNKDGIEQMLKFLKKYPTNEDFLNDKS
jgi:transcription termination factor Rho